MALTGKTNEEKIWNYLTAQGLTEAGAAGLWAICTPKALEAEKPAKQL